MITQDQHLKFNTFLKLLENEFGNSDGLTIRYDKKYIMELSTVGVWLQKYLDELGVTEMDFTVVKGQIVITKLKYEDILGYGYYPNEYKVELKDNEKPFRPNNIKSITRFFE
ncbi:hypothetical protein [Aquimarina algiphila]|uniref:hypothetical protein n=1 Tax=Aquimarina algiphila TaxID=2047982 RepID=UPI0024911D43|nr:hypothetical protein [Aquimarina algiphila]